jgi:hypothetical protein
LAPCDAFGHIVYGFWFATGLAALLFIGLILNWGVQPDAGDARATRCDEVPAKHSA